MAMGYELSCTCGGKMPILLGMLMPPQKVCFFLFYCRACRCMSVLDMNAPKLACEHCQSEDVVPYGDPVATGKKGEHVLFQSRPTERFTAEQLTLTDGLYWCPACETFNLTIRDSGIRAD